MALGRRFLVIALASTLTAAALQSYDYIVIGAGMCYFDPYIVRTA
jgi:hypothetical protein